MIDVSCDGCGKRFKVKGEHAGKRTRCPSCGERITVPGEDDGLAAFAGIDTSIDDEDELEGKEVEPLMPVRKVTAPQPTPTSKPRLAPTAYGDPANPSYYVMIRCACGKVRQIMRGESDTTIVCPGCGQSDRAPAPGDILADPPPPLDDVTLGRMLLRLNRTADKIRGSMLATVWLLVVILIAIIVLIVNTSSYTIKPG
jgi:ribosomal protein S27E